MNMLEQTVHIERRLYSNSLMPLHWVKVNKAHKAKTLLLLNPSSELKGETCLLGSSKLLTEFSKAVFLNM